MVEINHRADKIQLNAVLASFFSSTRVSRVQFRVRRIAWMRLDADNWTDGDKKVTCWPKVSGATPETTRQRQVLQHHFSADQLV
jgi:hypothetical protein